MEFAIDLGHFIYTINSFHIKKPETYEKAIIFNQAEEQTEAI